MIEAIQAAVSIPVMAKVRIGHFVEAQILESLEVDCIDESEVLTPADEEFHVEKRRFKTPFVCGCRDLGEALRRIHEGAAMIRTKGEAGTGNVVEAVRHMRALMSGIRALRGLDERALAKKATSYRVPVELVAMGRRGAAPAGAELLRRRRRDARRRRADDAARRRGGVRRLGHLQVERPRVSARARSSRGHANFEDPKVLAEASKGLGEPMSGLDVRSMPEAEKFAPRGW
jgi:pyridoxal 5'-phosphate synthase pdxS subunit